MTVERFSINEPAHGSIVLYKYDSDPMGEYRLVKIIKGSFLVRGRVSNYWDWQEIGTDGFPGKITHGYGYFYKDVLTNTLLE